MHDIQDIRLTGGDLVARAHNGTEHLRDVFASATEATLAKYVSERLALLDDVMADATLTMQMLDVPEKRPLPVRKAIRDLDIARCQHRAVTEAIAYVLRMRETADNLARILGPEAADFLAMGNAAQHFTRDRLDELLRNQAQRVQLVRQQCGMALANKENRLTLALIAIHDVRCILFLMLCQHASADDAYVAAVELLTGTKPPQPFVSTLIHTEVELARVMKVVTSATFLDRA